MNISIIELPLNLGLRVPSTKTEPGVKKLPEWLQRHGFHKQINADNIQSLIPPPYSLEIDPESNILNADSIATYAKEQVGLMNKVLSENKFPLVIGGDCSILIGNAVALKKHGDYALFYLDGHTDFIEPEQSNTCAAGGMASAIAAGYGPKKLSDINGLSPYFKENNVWCVGNREYDEFYERPIRESKAHYIDLISLRKIGFEQCVYNFLNIVNNRKLDGFWIHVDVDVLDDEVMPAVDSRTHGGLLYEEFNKILYLLLSAPKARGIEITILDPDLDPTGKYTKEFVHHFCNTFNKAKVNR